ncbi:MAG: sigma-54-dependent Fis family transcriptional regulator [Proteobacteria bacterium]|nr:MAG: sigma-54-dependent Fis family transcriptional regulator [Pseudomonadota bacterium]
MNEPTPMQHSAEVMRFVHGTGADVADRELHSTAIGDSWRRCVLDYSLDPASRCTPVVLDQRALTERLARHAELVQIASAEIDWLYEYIAASDYALLLTDASGVVLYERADPNLRSTLRAANLIVGADWSEQQAGTNGIGTCIAVKHPITVHRDEHFHACHISLSCSGAPIHDPAGALVAVLDASTVAARDTRASQAHTMALVHLSAQLIEKHLFLRHFRHGTILRFHARPELVNLQHDAALALSDDAKVVAADEMAIRLLGAGSREELVGRPIEEIFDVRAEELIDPIRFGQPALRPVRDVLLGHRFYASVAHGEGCARTSFVRPAERTCAGTHEVLHLEPATARKTTFKLEDLAGEDPQMRRNVRSARRIAASRVPVMIQGATGAGKEVFARALHAASDRASRPFVALNCAAIPESLIESELFGYRPGAFTGARREGMKGKILQSSGGTLFLDEIGDMPLALQTRLLRVLEEQVVVPLGGETPVPVDLRVICASHQNLRAMIARGQFREDLYYRLNGITLELPRLAQRTDKERLIRELLVAETSDGRPAAIEMDAFQCLLAYDWPGNIRELRNVIRTALAICDGGVVRRKDLPTEVREGSTYDSKNPHLPETTPEATASSVHGSTAPPSRVPRSPLEEAEREALLRAIRNHDGNMSHAAQALGVSRSTLYRRCKRLDIPLLRMRGVLV